MSDSSKRGPSVSPVKPASKAPRGDEDASPEPSLKDVMQQLQGLSLQMSNMATKDDVRSMIQTEMQFVREEMQVVRGRVDVLESKPSSQGSSSQELRSLQRLVANLESEIHGGQVN